MVERNIVFNESDTHMAKVFATIPGDMLNEGEREKIIQHPTNNVEDTEEPENSTVNNNQNKEDSKDTQKNSISFPITSDQSEDSNPQSEPETQPQVYGRGL